MMNAPPRNFSARYLIRVEDDLPALGGKNLNKAAGWRHKTWVKDRAMFNVCDEQRGNPMPYSIILTCAWSRLPFFSIQSVRLPKLKMIRD